MAVRIRLARVGRTHLPMYRLVAIDSRKKRNGEALDIIGTYDALKGAIVQFNEELYNAWIAKGAQASDSAHKIYRLFKKNGVAVVSAKERMSLKSVPVAPVAVVAEKEVSESFQEAENAVSEHVEDISKHDDASSE